VAFLFVPIFIERSQGGGLKMSLTAVDCALPCHLVDPDLFFAESPADVERAKALCVDCPLRATCLTEALDRREPWGVWGGQLVISGVVVPRKRPRGRPRKHDVVAA
jgi:WhiB family redox-sensing transcriptional regulator